MIDSIRGGSITFGFWAYRLVILNIYFLLFSLLGLIVFGVIPSTMATYTLIHERSRLHPWAMFLRFKDVYLSYLLRSVPYTIIIGFLFVTARYTWFLINQNLDVLTLGQYSVLLASFVITLFIIGGIVIFSLALNLKLTLRVMDNLKLMLMFSVTKFYVMLILLLMFLALTYIYMNVPMLFFAIGIPSYLAVAMCGLEYYFYPVLDKMLEIKKEL